MDLFKSLRYADHWNQKARRLFTAACLCLVALAILAISLFLPSTPQLGVVAGFLAGLSTTIATAAVATYRDPLNAERQEIRRAAEQEILHERLNDLAKAAGLPTLDVAAGEIDQRVRARAERIAHFSGLDEHRTFFLDE